jgi:membrane-bound lytic murein transglycosylase C
MRRLLLLNFKTVYNNGPHGMAERLMQSSGKNVLTAELRENTLCELITGHDRDVALKEMDKLISTVLASADRTEKRNATDHKVYSLKFHIFPKGLEADLIEYHEIIADQAEGIEDFGEIVKAIAQVESGFNPMAKSQASAYGLMQIVPHSAGIEISKALYGKPILMLPSYFFDVNRNIEAGIVYLSILNEHYFSNIKDPVSRLYCVISAYNGGPGTVARAFVGSKNIAKAVEKINQMTSEEVYDRLISHLPYKETREYLEKVLAAAEK